MALSPLQVKMIRRLLKSGTEDKIAHAIEKVHPSDLSILFSELAPNETQRLVNSLFKVEKAGETLSELPEFLIPDILELIEDKRLSEIISRVEPDDAFFLLEKVPESRWSKILDSLPPEQKEKLDQLLLYPKDSAGSVMTSDFIQVNVNMTAQEAIESLRSQPDKGGSFYVYVIDDGGQLLGVQSLRNLVMANPKTVLKDIMSEEVHAISANETQEKAAEMVSQYNLLAIPVVSDSRKLLGVITVDDVIDIFEEEATEDIYNYAGLSEVDRAATPLMIKVKKRLPWMFLNLLTAAATAAVVGLFQASIDAVVTLAIFMPIVALMGGNVALQSLTVISRAIAIGELGFVNATKAVLRETGNGLILGLISGLIMGLAGFLLKENLYLGFVLFSSMILNLLMGGFVGAIVPLIFTRLKLDPAVGTTVVVTLFTDVLGFLFFLGIATLLLTRLA